MLKMLRKFAWVLMLLLMLCVSATSLAEEVIDLGRTVDLSIIYEHEGAPLKGITFRFYRIATVNEAGEATLVPPFSGYPVSLDVKNELQLTTLASTLEVYVLQDHIAEDASGATNDAGRMRMTLKPGYYLVLGERHVQDGQVYETQPAVVMLPTKSPTEAGWDYEAVLYPKYDMSEEPGEQASIRRKVLKVWNDGGNERSRPAQVKIHLLRDGEIYDSVALTADGNWRHTWENLDARYSWRVMEEIPKGYTVEISREGVTFVVRNTKEGPIATPTPPPSNPNLPQTGQLWWPVPALVAGGLLMLIIGMLRSRREQYEK